MVTPHRSESSSPRQYHGSGICGIPSPAEGRTLEVVSDVARHGCHGVVSLTFLPAHPGSLIAELSIDGRERARCASLGSIRLWGRFSCGTHIRVAAAGPVRLVARTPTGEVLAGPVELRPERPWATFQW